MMPCSQPKRTLPTQASKRAATTCPVPPASAPNEESKPSAEEILNSMELLEAAQQSKNAAAVLRECVLTLRKSLLVRYDAAETEGGPASVHIGVDGGDTCGIAKQKRQRQREELEQVCYHLDQTKSVLELIHTVIWKSVRKFVPMTDHQEYALKRQVTERKRRFDDAAVAASLAHEGGSNASSGGCDEGTERKRLCTRKSTPLLSMEHYIHSQANGAGSAKSQWPKCPSKVVITIPAPRNSKQYSPTEIASILMNATKKERALIIRGVSERELVPCKTSALYKLVKKKSEGKRLPDSWGQRGRPKKKEDAGDKLDVWLGNVLEPAMTPLNEVDNLQCDSEASSFIALEVEIGRKTEGTLQEEQSEDEDETAVEKENGSTKETIKKMKTSHKEGTKNARPKCPLTEEELKSLPAPENGYQYSKLELAVILDGAGKQRVGAYVHHVVENNLVPCKMSGCFKTLRSYKNGRDMSKVSWGSRGRPAFASVEEVRTMVRTAENSDTGILQKEDIKETLTALKGKAPSKKTVRAYTHLVHGLKAEKVADVSDIGSGMI